jgi:hypothetical protein
LQPSQNYCPSGVVEIDVDIYPHRTNEDDETVLRSAECTSIIPLYRLKPIDGNPVSNSLHHNSKVVCNPKEFMVAEKKKKFTKRSTKEDGKDGA